MELKISSGDKNSITIEVIGENETVLNPILQKLLADKTVDYAEVIREHPLLSNPKIYIKMKNGNPKDALRGALKSLLTELEDFENAVESVLPKEEVREKEVKEKPEEKKKKK